MLYDFITTDKKLNKPLYQQIYLSIREAQRRQRNLQNNSDGRLRSALC